MKTIIKYCCVVTLSVLLNSCYTNKEIAVIKTGGVAKEKLEKDEKVIAPTNGETYLTYNKNNKRELVPSNVVSFYAGKKMKFTPVYTSTVHYPFATFDKKFYYTNFKTAVIDPIGCLLGIAGIATCIVGAVPTYGQSLIYIDESASLLDFTPYDFTYYKSKKCRNGDCIGKQVTSNVQLDIDLYCQKNNPMKEILVIIDNLPEGAKLNSYKIIKGKGKLLDIVHNTYMKDGKEYHEYRLIGKNNQFAKKHTKIKIKQNITYQFKEGYFD
jgi:hypothetical protein